MKLKKTDRRVNRSFLVEGFVPSDVLDMNATMSSDVMDDSSASPK